MNVTSSSISSSLASSLPAATQDVLNTLIRALTSSSSPSGGGSSPTTTVLLSSLSSPSSSWKQVLIPGLLGYMLLCRTLRYRRENNLRRQMGYETRESFSRMTTADAQIILKTLGGLEMPQLNMTALQFGLFKTYGIESIAKLLLATRALTDPVASRKRYEDTALLIDEFLSHPPDSPRSLKALARINYLHNKYRGGKNPAITNPDLLYTLSVFVLEPARFAEQYDWRPHNDMERCASGCFWKSVGDAMGIEYRGELPGAAEGKGWKDGLEFFDEIKTWAKNYEAKMMRPSKVCAKPAEALIPMLTYWAPTTWGKKFAAECVAVLMGDRVRDAFLIPEPGIGPSAIIYTSLVVRRFFLRYLSLPRGKMVRYLADEPNPETGRYELRTSFGNYPFYRRPNLWNRWLSPLALFTRLYGGKVPGDDPAEFMPEGYSWEDLGPLNRMGNGREEMEKDVEVMMGGGGRGGCPFSVAK